VIPALGEYPSQRPAEQRSPRLRHTYTFGAFGASSERFIDRFIAAMDDDLNAPSAMAAIFDYVNELYAAGVEQSEDLASLLAVYRCLTTHLAVFGVEIARPELHPELCAEYAVPPAAGEATGRGGDAVLDKLVAMRAEARKAKDFAKGDAIRKLLAEAGVEIEDTPQGPRWTVK
jgi:cysteinyl-tRNA synthetase